MMTMEWKDKITVWILTELYYPEEAGSGYFITKIAEEIARRHHVCVLTVQPTYAARGTKAPVNEVISNVHIHRCRATALDKDNLIFRLLNLLTISISIFFNALFKIHKNDIVLVITNPPSLPLIACLVCKLRGASFMLRLEDIYPEVLIASGLVPADSVFVKIINIIHIQIYRRAAKIQVLGREMLHLIHEKVGNGTDRFHLVTHWADTDQIVPRQKKNNPVLTRLGLQNQFVVQYSGNMGRTHDLESLVRCAKLLEERTDIHFLFVGSGAKEAWLKRNVAEMKLKNVTIMPPQDRSDLANLLNACDLAVISFVGGMAGVSVPSRMYNIMSAGKPILAVADQESELSKVVLEEKIGWVLKPKNPDMIARTILEAKAHPELLASMSSNARAAAVEKYARPIIMQKHRELMDSFYA